MRISPPTVNPRRGPPYSKAVYDPFYDLAASTPGTPQYKYVRGLGPYRFLRWVHAGRDAFRANTRQIGFWGFVLMLGRVFYVAFMR